LFDTVVNEISFHDTKSGSSPPLLETHQQTGYQWQPQAQNSYQPNNNPNYPMNNSWNDNMNPAMGLQYQPVIMHNYYYYQNPIQYIPYPILVDLRSEKEIMEENERLRHRLRELHKKSDERYLVEMYEKSSLFNNTNKTLCGKHN
jgi:hypothetical protein